MDFTERFELYKEGGMITDADIEDIKAVIALFKDKYGVTLEEENAKEPVDELPKEVVDELESLDTYDLSKKILEEVMQVTKNPLNETEQGYALLHINNLIAQFKESGEWHA